MRLNTPKMLLLLLILWGPRAFAEGMTIEQIITTALARNPDLQSIIAAGQSLNEKANAATYWPDPVISGNYFIKPIETKVGPQIGNAMITQGIPWPGKNSAKEIEMRGMAEATSYKAENKKLDMVVQIKSLAYAAYSEIKSLEFNQSEKNFIGDLTKVALAKVRVGSGGQQDVTAATLELSQLEEKNRLISERLASLTAQVNLLADLPPDNVIIWPKTIETNYRNFSDANGWKALIAGAQVEHPMVLGAQAMSKSAAAEIKSSELSAIPDIKASFGWVFIDEDRAMTKSDKDQDAYSVGLTVSVPLWFGKYNRASDSARQKKMEADWQVHSSLKKLESEIADLWQQAASSSELIKLYESTILPQAEQILASNQSSYQQNVITFDRVIGDFRKTLMLKNLYFKEQARLATLVAKLEARTAKTLSH